MIIDVSLPCNLTERDRHLFEPYTTYLVEELKTLQLRDVFVTYSGLCISEAGLVRESHHSDTDKYAGFLKDALYYINKACEDADSVVVLDDDFTYLLIHHPWSSNYWHWMFEALPRILRTKEQLNGFILILPAHFRDIEFVQSTLMAFHFLNTIYVPLGKSLRVKNLCLPQIKPVCDSYYNNDIYAIRKLYSVNIKVEQHSRFGDKLYISRSKAAKRKASNEEEVKGLLESYGFVCINNEDYTFREQVGIFSHGRYLISVHGAGLTNMVFMRTNSSILELHKRITNEGDWHSLAFWYLADALGFDYYHQLCEPSDSRAHFFEADLIVDTLTLEKNVRMMLGL